MRKNAVWGILGVITFALLFLSSCNSKKVYFIAPKDGSIVSKKFKVEFGVRGMEVRPAGEIQENTGHHHLIVDGGPVAEGEIVPADSKHIHYGLGQTETELELSPGKHTLTLQFADGAHMSYGSAMSSTITIEVRE